MGTFHSNQFPRETEDYRRARDQLLELEIKLRKQLEEVASLRCEPSGQRRERRGDPGSISRVGLQENQSDKSKESAPPPIPRSTLV